VSAVSVEVDASAVVDMLDQLAARAGGADAIAYREAQAALSSIGAVPVDTGELAGSFAARRDADGATIVNTTPYARYVFGGTRHLAARPPTLGYTAAELAGRVTEEVFRG